MIHSNIQSLILLANSSALSVEFEIFSLLAAFGWGFLASLTPCVYPMIPIIIAIFGTKDETTSRKQAVLLATVYVGGTIITYCTLGVIFAYLGKQLGSMLAEPWVIFPLCAFYTALALSMFGVFTLSLPNKLNQTLNKIGSNKGYFGALSLGLIGGLTTLPCTGPFLASIVTVIAELQDLYIGVLLMFSYAIGISVLLWFLAIFSVSIPKSGYWMDSIKDLGGVFLLLVSLYFLRPVVPLLIDFTSNHWLFPTVACLFIAIGFYIKFFIDKKSPTLRRRITAIVLVLTGLFGLMNWILTPEKTFQWEDNEAIVFEKAKKAQVNIMLDFSAEWCLPCKEMDIKTFVDKDVTNLISNHFIPFKIDVTSDENIVGAKLRKKYKANTLPSIIFVTDEGVEVGRISTFVPPEDFIKIAEKFVKIK